MSSSNKKSRILIDEDSILTTEKEINKSSKKPTEKKVYKTNKKSTRKSTNKKVIIDEEENLNISGLDSIEQYSESKFKEFLQIKSPKMHFQLVSNSSISIEFEPANSINDEAENILVQHGATFDEEMKIWFSSFKTYPQLLESLKELKEKYIICKIPQMALEAKERMKYTYLSFTSNGKKIEIDYTDDEKNKKYFENLPEKFRSQLYPFQKEGIQFGIEKHGRLLFADEMGVGKTIQSIALCYIFRKEWPVLIICPGSVKYSWQSEINRWLRIKPKYIQIINNGKDTLSKKSRFYIISYDLARRISKKLLKKKFDFVILDESHCIKNKDALRSSAIIPIAQRSKRLLLLSGTPLLSRPIEGYTALNCLRPDLFDNFQEYGRRYCDPILTQFGINWSGASNTKELHFIFNCLMVRRLKKDVLSQLPPKRRMKKEIDCSPESLIQLKKFFEGRDRKEKEANITMPEAYRITGEAKIKGVSMYVKELLEAQIKFIIFAHHHSVLNAIEEVVRKAKVKYIRIDGNTDGSERFQLVNKFQATEDCLVAILGINAASTGITLTEAKLVVFAELTWTPAIMIQAEDRAHRIGQNADCVDIMYLYGRNTLDDLIFKKIQTKMKIVSTTLDDRQVDLGLKEQLKEKKNEEKEDKEEEEEEEEVKEDKEESNKKENKEREIEENTVDMEDHIGIQDTESEINSGETKSTNDFNLFTSKQNKKRRISEIEKEMNSAKMEEMLGLNAPKV